MSRSGKTTHGWIVELLSKSQRTEEIVRSHFRVGVTSCSDGIRNGVETRLIKVNQLLTEAKELLEI